MEKKIAVVFDSAGTLLHMYRVAKNTRTGSYIQDIITTELVGRKPHCGLVVIHTDPDKILGCHPNKRIYDFLVENNINIDLSCSSSPMSLDDVRDVIEKDLMTTMGDIHDVIKVIKNKCPNITYLGVGIIVDIISLTIIYTICTGGRLFPNSSEALDSLKGSGVDAYIASGDSMRNLEKLARMVNIPVERVYDVATPQKKEWVIRHLKGNYEKVIMVGDGINDILAFRASDLSVLSVQQTGTCSDRLECEADLIIDDISRIVTIAEEIKSN